MKIAIVHDELVRKGGAEQVTLLFHKAFPQAPIYTSCYNLEKTYEEFRNCIIKTSWINRFIKNENTLKALFYPFVIWSMKSLSVKDYDVVLMSTTTGAKFVNISKKTKVISFCHYPFRLAWFPESYTQYTNANTLKKIVFNFIIKRLKVLDFKAAQRFDYIITNTKEIATIIDNTYHPKNEIAIIPASFDCKNFYLTNNPTLHYYLVVARIEPYKKVDLVVEAFNQLPEKKLIIVGKGSQKLYCQSIANNNIEFRENISSVEMADLYANCKAFIFPQKEDYGLTPIEANASGRPVIAFGQGGVLYTTIPYNGQNNNSCTSILFEEQTVISLLNAIKNFDMINFNSSFIGEHGLQFEEVLCIESIRNFVINNKNKE